MSVLPPMMMLLLTCLASPLPGATPRQPATTCPFTWVGIALRPSHLSRRDGYDNHRRVPPKSSSGCPTRSWPCCSGRGRLTRGADVLCPGFGEDVLRPGDFL